MSTSLLLMWSRLRWWFFLGSKGGEGIRLKLGFSSYCFLNCHLAANVEKNKQGNIDYHNIREGLKFPKPATKYTNVECHDNVFCMGDANSRHFGSDVIDINQVMDHLKDENYTSLLEYDQLLEQQAKSKMFFGYTEATITFRPTYKYDPGTDDWVSKTNRVPRWCDRILWKGREINVLEYRSHSMLRRSDHKPVLILRNCFFDELLVYTVQTQHWYGYMNKLIIPAKRSWKQPF